MKESLKTTLALYRTILRWNGESASDLGETLMRLTRTAPRMLWSPIPMILHRFRYNRAMRFDLSRVNEPILAVDKKGYALVGSLVSLKIMQLATI
jgi:hypothetical protein